MGLHITDQFSFHLETFLLQCWRRGQQQQPQQQAGQRARQPQPGGSGEVVEGGTKGPSLQHMLDFIIAQALSSTVMVRTDLFARPLTAVGVAEFFGGGGRVAPLAPTPAATSTRGPASSGGGSSSSCAQTAEPRGGSDGKDVGQSTLLTGACARDGSIPFGAGPAANTPGMQQQEQEPAQQEPVQLQQQQGGSLTLRELLLAAGSGAYPPPQRPDWQWQIIHAADRLGLGPRELVPLGACGLPLLLLPWWRRWRLAAAAP